MEVEQKRERILPRLIEEEMRESFLDYSMSVIVQRALPDVRDGLKPVHRRILYSMHELGLRPDRAHKKSAAVVGDVLGKYHPHGDMAVYEALVRMVQDFSLRYPLVEGQGNFGSVDGDNAAAYRYTEVRLGSMALELLADIDRETVPFVPNFDGHLQEPCVLPARLPNLLVNGSSGIAVGMSTNVPPHNLREVAAAVRHLVERPGCAVADLMKRVRGPDFPTGGIVVGVGGIREMYETGRGRIVVRARVVKEALRGGKAQLVVMEIPYAVSKSRVIEQIADLVREKRLEDVTDLRDESDRDGIRVVIELKRGANAEGVLEVLFRQTHLQSTFGAILLALDGGQPREFNLKELLERYRDHRVEVVRRRSQHELERAMAELHVTEGLLRAVDAIDDVVALIRASKDRGQASERLRKRFKLSEAQASAILDMRLARLTALERVELKARRRDLSQEIARLEAILASEKKQLQVVLAELDELVERRGDGRRTVIAEGEAVDLEDVVAAEDVVVTLSHAGYVKRMPLGLFRRRLAGERPLAGMERYPDDYLERVFVARTDDRILLFCEGGQLHSLPVLDVPESGRASRGQSLYGLLGIRRQERIVAMAPVGDAGADRYLVFLTADGTVKRTPLRELSTVRSGGVIGVRLKRGDRLLDVQLSDGASDLVVLTRRGRAIRYPEADVPVMGRNAQGVRGIRLEKGDAVVGVLLGRRDAEILTVTDRGFAKRTAVGEYPVQRRGGLGTLTLDRSSGDLVAGFEVLAGDELMVRATSGEARRVVAGEVPLQGRTTRGIRVMELAEADRVVEVTRVARASGAGEGVPRADSVEGGEGAQLALILEGVR
ncbi:MAG: DNA gyrase subunit A [Gemmatimonadetes bacterium]|nr:DNA gyrase subunit A [Gemmatimonadota bacterium]